MNVWRQPCVNLNGNLTARAPAAAPEPDANLRDPGRRGRQPPVGRTDADQEGVPAMNDSKSPGFDTAEITAIAHLYRGELYRSLTRLGRRPGSAARCCSTAL